MNLNLDNLPHFIFVDCSDKFACRVMAAREDRDVIREPVRRVNEFIHGRDFEAVCAKAKQSNIVLILGESCSTLLLFHVIAPKRCLKAGKLIKKITTTY